MKLKVCESMSGNIYDYTTVRMAPSAFDQHFWRLATRDRIGHSIVMDMYAILK